MPIRGPLSALLLSAALALLWACAGDPPPVAEKRIIGFVGIDAGSAWRGAETASLRDEAHHRGVILRCAAGPFQPEQQIAAVRGFIAQRVDAIILAPLIESGWEAVLREAKQAGIPVVLIEGGVKVTDEDLYVTVVAPDFVEEGRLAATWLARRLEGAGTVVELPDSADAAPTVDRQQGFAEVLAGHPGLRILRSPSVDPGRSTGKEVMAAFISASRRDGYVINAVYAHSDDLALGAIQAIEKAGLRLGVDLVVVSIGGVKPAFEALVAGTLNLTVECNPLLGPATLDAIEAAWAGKLLPRKIITPDRLFDQGAARDVIAERRY